MSESNPTPARPPKQPRTGLKSTGTRKAASKPGRSRAREFALQALYQHLVGGNEATAIDAFTRDLAGFHKADSAHYDALLHGCIATAADLDALITPLLDRKLAEISPIERATMWIGVYEFQHCLDVPWRVVLNECIELAKEFGGTDGHKYVNAVLNGLAPRLRAAEVAADKASSPSAPAAADFSPPSPCPPRPGQPTAPPARPAAMKFSQRAERIEPFYVMEVAKAAQALAREVAGTREPMVFLNIGEPDFTAPPRVQEAAARAVQSGTTQYTNALGLDALRERISGWYAQRFGVDVPARRIVVTAGASAALQLACLALIEAGDEILMPDPSYPCNRHFVSAAEGKAVLLPTTAEERYQLSAAKVAAAWGPKTRGVLLASPSNPTGTSIAPGELRRIHDVVRAHGGITLIDEIYLGLSYEEEFGHTALAIDENIVSINSFSKYFNMTGWRLGWMVVPEAMVPVVERLAQNLFICASTVSQHAALACFEAESIAEYERRRAEFKARRDFFIPALQALGLRVPVMPDGAFYAWADCTQAAERLGVSGSWDFAFELMRRAHIAVTPGRDFGTADTGRFVRFSTASSMAQLEEAVARLGRVLG